MTVSRNNILSAMICWKFSTLMCRLSLVSCSFIPTRVRNVWQTHASGPCAQRSKLHIGFILILHLTCCRSRPHIRLWKFITTISAWTGMVQKRGQWPSCKLGDSFKNALPGRCETKSTGTIFFWLAFGAFCLTRCSVRLTHHMAWSSHLLRPTLALPPPSF